VDAGRSRLRLRPTVMELEGRTLLSTLTVTKFGNDDGSTGTLSWAVGEANADGGGDTIDFDPNVFATPQQIMLDNTLELSGKAGTTTITGPAAGATVGSTGSRIFQIDGGVAASISGLTITNGGVQSDGGTLTLTNCTISGDHATYSGSGSGLNITGGATALTNCTVSGNFANSYGGGLLVNDATVTLTNCTVSGNVARGLGAGLAVEDAATVTMTNCTVSGNLNCGGLGVNDATVTLTNCTVSDNGTSGYGAGVYAKNDATVTLTNTIVVNNIGSSNIWGNIWGGGITGNYNLTDDSNLGGIGNRIGGGLNLAQLGDYGGPTQTMALLPGSAAIAGGTADGAPTTDQRNEPRTGHVDIGAFQSGGFTMTPVPGSSPQSAVVNAAFGQPLAITVTANNPVEPVILGYILFTVPTAGASATISPSRAAVITDIDGVAQVSVTATANGAPGQYTVTATAAGAEPTTFTLTNNEAPSLTVTTAADVVDATDGLTSLREAIADANAHPGPDTIVLAPGLLGSRKQTIRLTGGPLVLTDPATTTIVGPGAKRLTIRGGGLGRVFDVQGGSLHLSRLTISGGRADEGGGICNDGGRLVLSRVTLRGNSARILGGALFNDGTATLRKVTVTGNEASVGGGIANFGTLSMAQVTRRANRARFAGALFNGLTARLIRRWRPTGVRIGDPQLEDSRDQLGGRDAGHRLRTADEPRGTDPVA
jgi:hypothetical protein